MDEKIEQYILDIIFSTRNPDKYGLTKIKDYISLEVLRYFRDQS